MRWSVFATTLGERPQVIAELDADAELPSASAAKILVLLAASAGVEDAQLRIDEPLDRRRVAPVGDSGLWQHLASDALPLGDAATLVGAVSDNLATNVLIDRLGGVDAVEAVAVEMGIEGVHLHDIVRDGRMPQHPPALSTGTARGYATLMSRLAMADGIRPAVADRVVGWLAAGTDLSMVAAAFGLDPLAHTAPDRGMALVNKTGTDEGVRVDLGLVRGPRGVVAYASLAHWQPSAGDPERDAVLESMRTLGAQVSAAVGG
ncbi:serine hydrolase [Microbacterium fluvii]